MDQNLRASILTSTFYYFMIVMTLTPISQLTTMSVIVFADIAGKENVKIIKAVTGAEDFSFFQQKVPGIYFFIGGIPKGFDPAKVADHHTPDFYVDDSGMLLGMKTMTEITLDYLHKSR